MHPTELRAHCISARRFGSDHVDLVALFAQCMDQLVDVNRLTVSRRCSMVIEDLHKAARTFDGGLRQHHAIVRGSLTQPRLQHAPSPGILSESWHARGPPNEGC